MVGTEPGTLYNYSKPQLIVFTDPPGRVIVKQNAELSASNVTALQREVLAQSAFSSSSATDPTAPTPATNATAINLSDSAKPRVPGFEAIPSMVGVSIAALVLWRIGKSQR